MNMTEQTLEFYKRAKEQRDLTKRLNKRSNKRVLRNEEAKIGEPFWSKSIASLALLITQL